MGQQWYRRVVAVFTFVWLVAIVDAVSPQPVAASAFTYPCHNPVAYDYQNTIQRGAGLGGVGSDYHAVIGDADVRAVLTCTSPSGIPVGSFVLPANLQNSLNGGIVQLGYGICTLPSGAGSNCGDATDPVPADGHMHFLYICNDLSGGNICNGDSWYGSSPQPGQRYRFRLEWISNQWKYTLTNKSTGETHSKTITAHWILGDGAWWGTEAYDFNSTVGPKSTDDEIHMYWMQYLRNATGGAWQVATPVSRATCELSLSTFLCTGSWPSHFTGQVYSQNFTNDAVNMWTNAH